MMKKVIITLTAVIFVLHCKAQSVNSKDSISKQRSFGEPAIEVTTNRQINPNTIYSSVDQIPEFTGGMQGFNLYLKKNLKWPVGEEDAQGKVFLQFIVERDGSLTNFKVLRSPTLAFGDEAIRLMKKSPKWTPAKINGQPVRCYFTLPVDFQILR